MDFGWSPAEEEFRAEVGELLDSAMAEAGIDVSGLGLGAVHPSSVSAQEQVRRSKYVCGRLAEKGLLVPGWPAEYGGSSLGTWPAVILAEEVMRRGEPRGSQYMNVNWIGPSIIMAGTPEQKSYFLRRIGVGDITFCQGFSEPGAGSDLAALRTRAVRDGDVYVVNGEKIWTSHAQTAEYCYLLVRTTPGGEKHAGISILLVPTDTPGFQIRDIPTIGGLGQEVFANLTFTDMRVPVSARLGAENEGWAVIRRSLAFERVGIPRYLNAALRLDRVVTWAREAGMAADPDVRQQVGRAKARCDAARLLHLQAVSLRTAAGEGSGAGAQADSDAAAAVARVSIVEAERAVCEAAVQVMGQDGLVDGTPGAEYAGGIAAGIAAGAYEIQLDLVARGLLGRA
jgi:alkylation response protein AidB-like acyl-CoA dehydrogenase